MNNEQYNDIKTWFHAYVNDFLTDGSRFKHLIELKIEHCIHVAGHAKDIAAGLQWPQADILTSEVLGLLHDIGRFPQVAEFQTFYDPDSVNHGELGFCVVKESDVLSSLSKSDRERILDSVHYHNSREIPHHVNSDSLRFVKLVRDADKLDIYRIISDAVHTNKIKDHPEIMLNIDINGPPNPAALAQFLDHQTVSYKNIKSLTDFGFTQLSWIYDINYPYTLKYIAEHRIIEDIAGALPQDAEITQAVNSLAEYMKQKM